MGEKSNALVFQFLALPVKWVVSGDKHLKFTTYLIFHEVYSKFSIRCLLSEDKSYITLGHRTDVDPDAP